MLDWDRASVKSNVNEKVFIRNKIILNILSSFVPHETLTVDDKDPLWLQKKNYPREKQCLQKLSKQ